MRIWDKMKGGCDHWLQSMQTDQTFARHFSAQFPLHPLRAFFCAFLPQSGIVHSYTQFVSRIPHISGRKMAIISENFGRHFDVCFIVAISAMMGTAIHQSHWIKPKCRMNIPPFPGCLYRAERIAFGIFHILHFGNRATNGTVRSTDGKSKNACECECVVRVVFAIYAFRCWVWRTNSSAANTTDRVTRS